MLFWTTFGLLGFPKSKSGKRRTRKAPLLTLHALEINTLGEHIQEIEYYRCISYDNLFVLEIT